VFRIEHLRKAYEMGDVTVTAVRDATLDVLDGEFLVVLGPSGSGKSTLLNIIGGIDRPTSGRVIYRDVEMSQYSEAQLTAYRRQHIGFVFQFYNLIPNLTALENVEMATEISPKPLDAAKALELVGLSDRKDHFPSQLSGGEQQRVAIARAVAKQPDILLCDEPTGALDIATGKVVLGALNHVNVELGTTVVIITHNASIAQMADRVVRLKDGEVHSITVNPTRADLDQLEW
jgi:putative ABC transport system ATP-binding protein